MFFLALVLNTRIPKTDTSFLFYVVFLRDSIIAFFIIIEINNLANSFFDILMQ